MKKELVIELQDFRLEEISKGIKNCIKLTDEIKEIIDLKEKISKPSEFTWADLEELKGKKKKDFMKGLKNEAMIRLFKSWSEFQGVTVLDRRNGKKLSRVTITKF